MLTIALRHAYPHTIEHGGRNPILSNMADAPLTYSKYPFLKELGLEEENPGCYNGTWCGSGALYTSLNPTTGPS